jgi:vancomycin resistance protein YoaR
MTQQLRRWIIGGGVAAIVLLPVLFFALDSARASGEVARNVSAAGIELGGLGEQDALAALREYETELADTPAPFTVNGTKFTLIPASIGLNIDEDAIVATAMEQRRDKGFPGSLFSWFGSFGNHIEIDVPVTIDKDLLDRVLDEWQSEAIAMPAYEGGIIVEDSRILPDYPRPGEGIDRQQAYREVLASVQSIDRDTVALETTQIEPDLTKGDIDAATTEAARWIDADVTLSSDDPEFSMTFTKQQLADALVTTITKGPPASLELSFDAGKIGALLTPHKQEIEQPARDAEFQIDEENKAVTLRPSRAATVLDVNLVVQALQDAAASSSNSGTFPFGQGAEASFTTADAQAMGDVQFVSEFTTSHPAGQPRVTNIHLFADTVDGAMVMPGEEFSLNDYVGQRTTEKGYVSAPMILGGELVDDIGGGVSQFATTFFNAVFYGCYEDVTHKPHSYYFSRYPEVNEATISWPEPNLIFRNNTDTVVIIKTQYTATDITVQFYGNNGGCKVERVLGDRYGFTDPKEEYVGNPDLNPDEQKVTQKGFGGFSNTVKRVMTWPDGHVKEQTFRWSYLAEPKIIEVHPCMVPDATEECPVQVPSVVGSNVESARSALQALGLTLTEGDTVQVDTEASNGLIVDMSPSSGEWVPVGSTVTVNVGVYVPPAEPPPDTGG